MALKYVPVISPQERFWKILYFSGKKSRIPNIAIKYCGNPGSYINPGWDLGAVAWIQDEARIMGVRSEEGHDCDTNKIVKTNKKCVKKTQKFSKS